MSWFNFAKDLGIWVIIFLPLYYLNGLIFTDGLLQGIFTLIIGIPLNRVLLQWIENKRKQVKEIKNVND